MATIQHKDIADADRHEPKGAATAVAGSMPISNGDTTTTFRKVNFADMGTKPVANGYIPILVGSSTAASQQPSATNTALQVEFGAAQSLTDVSLSAAGVLTINTAGYYLFDIFCRFGRTTSAGTAIMFHRIKKNGVQMLNSNSITLTDTAQVIPFSTTLVIQGVPGDTYTFEIMRDSAGINNGGLFQTVPSAGGWNNSPSSTAVISKLLPLS